MSTAPEGKAQLNALIDQALHKSLKMRAIEEERPMSAILEDALRLYMVSKKPEKRPKK